VLALYLQAFELLNQHPPDSQVKRAQISLNIGRMYLRLNDYANAESYAQKGYAVLQEIYGPQHHRLISTELMLGTINEKLNRLDQAEKHYRQAAYLAELNQGERSYNVARAEFNLGVLKFQRLEQMDQSIVHFEKALDIVSGKKGRIYNFHHMQLVYSGNLISLGRYETAEEKIRESQAYYLSIDTKTGLNRAKAQAYLAWVLMHKNQLQAARDLLVEALPILEKYLGEDDYILNKSRQHAAELKKN